MYDIQFCIEKEDAGGKYSNLFALIFDWDLPTVRPTFSGFPQLLHITVWYVPQATIKLLQFHRT
jgi:hypothetical protein